MIYLAWLLPSRLDAKPKEQLEPLGPSDLPSEAMPQLLAGCSYLLHGSHCVIVRKVCGEVAPYFNAGVGGCLTVGLYSCEPASCMPLILCL